MVDDEKGFLQRWSERKLDNVGEASAPAVDETRPVAGRMRTEPPVEDGDDAAEDAAGTGKAETRTDAPAPMTAEDIAAIDFDALDEKSDYTRFMQDGVPDWVRRKALNKLYTMNPIFNQMDGLDHYDEDFADAIWAVGKVETSYKVGRGFMSDEEVAEWEALGAPEEEPEDEDEKAAPEADKVAAGDRTEDGEVAAADEAQVASAEDSAEQDEPGTEPETTEEVVATAGEAETGSNDDPDVTKA